jgi:hypothetical protein
MEVGMDAPDFGKIFRAAMDIVIEGIGEARREALPSLENKCKELGVAFIKSSKDFYSSKPTLQKMIISVSLGGGAIKEMARKEMARDISQLALEKLGVKNKFAIQMEDRDIRFNKLREGIQERRATHPDKLGHLNQLDNALCKAKATADGAYISWDKAKSNHAEARAQYRKARHMTDLARMDEKIAEDKLEKAAVALEANKKISPTTDDILNTRKKLGEDYQKAKTACETAVSVRKGRVDEENKERANAETLSKEVDKELGKLDEALVSYQNAVKIVKRETGIDTSTLSERLGDRVSQASGMVADAVAGATKEAYQLGKFKMQPLDQQIETLHGILREDIPEEKQEIFDDYLLEYKVALKYETVNDEERQKAIQVLKTALGNLKNLVGSKNETLLNQYMVLLSKQHRKQELHDSVSMGEEKQTLANYHQRCDRAIAAIGNEQQLKNNIEEVVEAVDLMFDKLVTKGSDEIQNDTQILEGYNKFKNNPTLPGLIGLMELIDAKTKPGSCVDTLEKDCNMTMGEKRMGSFVDAVEAEAKIKAWEKKKQEATVAYDALQQLRKDLRYQELSFGITFEEAEKKGKVTNELKDAHDALVGMREKYFKLFE